jgi:hypothetical protein
MSAALSRVAPVNNASPPCARPETRAATLTVERQPYLDRVGGSADAEHERVLLVAMSLRQRSEPAKSANRRYAHQSRARPDALTGLSLGSPQTREVSNLSPAPRAQPGPRRHPLCSGARPITAADFRALRGHGR